MRLRVICQHRLPPHNKTPTHPRTHPPSPPVAHPVWKRTRIPLPLPLQLKDPLRRPQHRRGSNPVTKPRQRRGQRQAGAVVAGAEGHGPAEVREGERLLLLLVVGGGGGCGRREVGTREAGGEEGLHVRGAAAEDGQAVLLGVDACVRIEKVCDSLDETTTNQPTSPT